MSNPPRVHCMSTVSRLPEPDHVHRAEKSRISNGMGIACVGLLVTCHNGSPDLVAPSGGSLWPI